MPFHHMKRCASLMKNPQASPCARFGAGPRYMSPPVSRSYPMEFTSCVVQSTTRTPRWCMSRTMPVKSPYRVGFGMNVL